MNTTAKLRLPHSPAVLLPAWSSLASGSSAATATQDYVSAMQSGWNLGRTLDAMPGETSGGNPRATPALLPQIAAQGFKSIRIPVTRVRRMPLVLGCRGFGGAATEGDRAA